MPRALGRQQGPAGPARERPHTQSERTLRAAGHIQEILGGRHALQNIVEDDLRRLVTQATGREVKTVLSATRLEPDLSAEIFILAPDVAEADALAAEGGPAQDGDG